MLHSFQPSPRFGETAGALQRSSLGATLTNPVRNFMSGGRPYTAAAILIKLEYNSAS